MSLSDEQPASLIAADGQLGKGKPAGCRMDSPKEISQAGFEWQRTEGKLNEIGLNVSMDGRLKDGLVKNASFLEQSKLCFFEGKLDKELSVDVQGREYPAAAGHLPSRYVISETCQPSEGTSLSQKTAELSPGTTQGSGKDKGKDGVENRGQPDLGSTGTAGIPSQCVKEQETSLQNPNFHPEAQGPLGSRGAALEKEENGLTPVCPAIGVANASSGQLLCETLVAVAHPVPTIEQSHPSTPPVTMVELTPEYLNASSHARDQDQELEKPSSAEEGAVTDQASQQKKAVRRALSECSHLSVPPAVDLAEKYPELPVREVLSSGLLPPAGSPTPSPAPRKLGAPAVRRSMTVAEEQMSSCTPSPWELPVQSTDELSPSACEGPAARQRADLAPGGGSSSGKKEPGSAELTLRGKLEQIPEGSSEGKGQREVSEARRADGSPACLERENPPEQTAVTGRKEIQVTAAQSPPSLLCEGTPRDGMLLNVASIRARQTAGQEAE